MAHALPPVLGESLFSARMAALGPFSDPPALAVAVSGGPDSLTLIHLAHAWATARGGAAVALTVDHGLRPESAAEARRVAAWMDEAGIPHHILVWPGEKPTRGVQEAARRARYGLLDDWCVAHGVADLLTAHHLDDQAETFVLRLARGSGVSGLAAMRPVRTLSGGTRLLRPLLDIPKAALLAYLRGRGLPWIDDPSNANGDFDRVKARRVMPVLAGIGVDAATLCKTAARLARAGDFLDGETDGLLRRVAALDRLGFARVDLAALGGAHPEIGLRALSRLLTCVGGRELPPRLDPVERLWGVIRDGGTVAATLSGCRVLSSARFGAVFCREAAACAPPVTVGDDGSAFWDGRFRWSGLPAGAVVGRLDGEAWRQAEQGWPEAAKALKAAVPAAVRAALPGVLLDGALTVPPFAVGASVCFAPVTPLFPRGKSL